MSDDAPNTPAPEAAPPAETVAAPSVPVVEDAGLRPVRADGSTGSPGVPAEAPTHSQPEPDDFAEVPSEETVMQHHFTAPAYIALNRLEDDQTFLIRSAESLDDVSELATDIARLGQLFPIEVRVIEADKLQIISGFRRVAALRFLQREKVVATIHHELSDSDAMMMALAAAIHSRSVEAASLLAARERLEAEGHLTAAARDMLDKALATESALGPESVEEEVDADELAGDVTMRLGQCNQDLSLLADVFEDLDDERRDALLQQLRYSIELVGFLESKK